MVPKPAAQKVEVEKTRREKPFLQKNIPALLTAFFFLIAAFMVWRFLVPHNKIKKDGSLNVLLITMDTTRANRLGCYGYQRAKTPNLDRLAAKGVEFLNVYCQVPLTTPSHCSILTGTYPLYHQVRNNGAYVLSAELTTLAEVLDDKGFATAAFVSSFTVDSRFGLDQGFEIYDDKFAEAQAFKAPNSERKAEKTFESFSRWLGRNQARPFFCWVHYYDPHLPYDPPAPYNVEFADSPYDGEIAYMDQVIGKTIEALREKGLLARTLVILAGDHGEAFGEKVEAGHGVFIYDGTMKVPLIFYAENHLPAGLIIKSRVRLIDLMPSVLDMLNIQVNKDVQGTSLLPYISGKKKEDLSSYIETYFPRENYGWSELVGLVDGDWKYIRAPREELYNLKADPEEIKNTVGAENRVANEKKARLEDAIARYSSGIKPGKKELTAEEKEKLRSLGYLSQSAGAPQGPLPDPKDMVEELRMNQQAEIHEFEGNYAEAARVYERILSLRPENPTNYVNLALTRAKMNEFDEALRVLEQGVARIPDSEVLLSRLAHTYMVMGRLEKAMDVWQAVLVTNPRYFDALLASGWILDFTGKLEEAGVYFNRAQEVEPENRFLRKYSAENLAKRGMIKEAINVYELLKEDYPDDYEIFQNLGIAYGYAGDLSRSIENLKKAVALHPTPVAYSNLAVASRKAGAIQEAIDYLKLYLGNPEGENEESIKSARQELAYLEKLLKQ